MTVAQMTDNCSHPPTVSTSVSKSVPKIKICHASALQPLESDNLDIYHLDAFGKVKARRPVSRLSVKELEGLRGLDWVKK